MKQLTAVILSLIIFSCTPNKIESEQLNSQEDDLITFADYTPEFQRILKNEVGTFRGTNIGDSLSAVLSSNDLLFEYDSSLNLLTFEEEISIELSADYEYQITNKVVSKITCICYTSKQDFQDQLLNELRSYYDHKFNKKESNSWDLQGGYTLEMKRHSIPTIGEFDIELIFEKN